jgi:hypothetical protein
MKVFDGEIRGLTSAVCIILAAEAVMLSKASIPTRGAGVNMFVRKLGRVGSKDEWCSRSAYEMSC